VVRLVAREVYVFFLCLVVRRLASLKSAICVLVLLVGGDVASLVWGLFSGLRKAEKCLESASKIWLSLTCRPRKVGLEAVLHHHRLALM
jgi:hypothetical protein